MKALSGDTVVMQPPSIGRMLLVAFMLVAFVFQGYATQTHIHPQDFADSGIVLKASGEPGHKNAPPSDDPANCPICQQIMQAGLFVAPAWLLPLLITFVVSTIE